MDTPNTTVNTGDTVVAPVAATPIVAPAEATVTPRGADTRRVDPRGAGGFPPRRGGMRKGDRKGTREGRAKPEFDQKILAIRRVTRVAAGGRRFSFSVALVAGDRKGHVGVGIGKASDTSLAIDKAMRNAKKQMVTIRMTKENSIAHDVETKYASARVMIQPAPGRGIVAGSAVRTVIELAGLRDVTAKIFSRSKNKLNIARATVKALGTLRSAKVS